MKKSFVAILLIINGVHSLFAQQDSSLLNDQSDTILIEQKRLPEFGLGQHQLHLSSEVLQKYQSQNLAQVLQLESTIFVKNYGPSGISTLSGRGSGASHTAVLWEGFNLQSPMLGQTDISLLPTIFVDHVDVQYGGTSALFGNSSIGGAVHLGTQSKYQKGWQFAGNLHGGSFENWGQSLKLSYSNHWYAGSIRTFYKSAKNDFFFTDVNAFGSPKPIKRQHNATTRQLGILQENNFKIKQHQLGIKFWYQNSNRQIPPTLLQDSSQDQQLDASFRTVAHWKWFKGNHALKARSALFLESLQFTNQAVNSLSKILSSITEIEHKWYLHDLHRLNTGLTYSFYQAISSGYTSSPQQHRLALFLAYKISTKNQRWQNSLSIREEVVDGRFTTPAVSLGSVWKFYRKWNLKVHLSHNYRLPTFNDLYWNVLGNPDLRPEYSWNSELGIQIPMQWKQVHLKAGITGFCNLINDWILWSPNSAGLWRPSNVEQVWSRGLELNAQTTIRWKKWTFLLGANYAYTQSTRTKGEQAATIGKQLIYVPLHNLNMQFQIQFKQTSLLYQHSLTSTRFVNNENTEQLPLFHVGHLRLSHQFSISSMRIRLYCQINNLFGHEYQIVSQRPMPWQQVEIGLNLQL